jgi:hypothetical protein
VADDDRGDALEFCRYDNEGVVHLQDLPCASRGRGREEVGTSNNVWRKTQKGCAGCN